MKIGIFRRGVFICFKRNRRKASSRAIVLELTRFPLVVRGPDTVCSEKDKMLFITYTIFNFHDPVSTHVKSLHEISHTPNLVLSYADMAKSKFTRRTPEI